MDAWDRRDTRAAAGIVGLAFAIRLVRASMQTLVGTDSPAFLLSAVEIESGDWATGLKTGIHPGYPLAISLFGMIFGGHETGAYAASVFFSSLAMVPFYALVRDMADRRVAIVAGLFFACLPYHALEHADIMTEGLFHFLFVTSVTLSWYGATRENAAWCALAGFTGGLAYLTRAEGVYTGVALPGIAFFVVARALWRKERPPWATLAYALLGAALWIAVASPLMLWFGGLSMRGSVGAALGTREEGTPPGLVVALGRYAFWMFRASFGVVLALAATGLVFARRLKPPGLLYLACLVAGYSLGPIRASMNGYPMSPRYILVPVLFLVPLAALACVGLVEAAQRRWRAAPRVGAAVLGLLFVGFAVRTVHPRVEPEEAVKDAAAWLKTRGDARVLTDGGRLAWYMRKRVGLLPGEPDRVIAALADADYVVINPGRLDRNRPGVRERVEEVMRPAARFPERADPERETIVIYSRGSR